MKKILPLFLLLILLSSISLAQDHEVDLYVYHGQGCPHCDALLHFLEEDIEPNYPTLNIIKKEVYGNKENREEFMAMGDAFNKEVGGVPTIFIDEKVMIGYHSSMKESIEQEIQRCIQEGCESPIEKLNGIEGVVSIEAESSPLEDPLKTETKKALTIPAVFSAAAVDAINPCAFAVLIILLTTILAAGIKRRVLLSGLAFTLSIYISYLLMGIGLYSAIQVSGLTHKFYTIVAVLAILIGLFNLKDYLWYGKWFIMEVPMKWRPKLKSLLKGITSVPGAFFIGFVVSLFLLPCTSGPYIVILGLLAKVTTRNYAILLLLLYNLIFILPMLIITLAIYFGFTTVEKAEKWRKSKLKVLHLIAGIILLLLGIGMFVAVKFGLV